MTLEEAISYVIEKEGICILSEARLVNYLNDLQAFGIPALKRIISTMTVEGYFSKLLVGLNGDSYELQFNDVSTNLVQKEGFQFDLVQYVLDCLLYAVHKTGKAPSLPESATSNSEKKRAVNHKSTFNVIHANGNIFLILKVILMSLKRANIGHSFVKKTYQVID